MKMQQTIYRLVIICAAVFFASSSHGQALDDYQTRASGNWASVGTWERFDGVAWQNVTGIAPNTIPASGDGVITILSGHTVTVAANVSVDQATVAAGGQITINSSRTLTVANGAGTDMTVNGTIDNSGTFTTTGTLIFGANSFYLHTRNAGTIPTATWNTTSTCTVSGITSTIPGGLGQSFGNFTWNCTGQSSTVTLTGLTAVTGNFTIASTGTSDILRLTTSAATLNIGKDFIFSGGNFFFTNSANIAITINVSGNYTQSGGNLDYSTAANMGAGIMNITGNFSQSGGSFDWGTGGANTARIPAMNLSGNFSQTGAATMTLSSLDNQVTNGTVTFNKAGTQTFSIATQANLTYTNFTIASGSTLTLNSSITLSSYNQEVWAGTFTVNNNATLDAGTNQVLSSTGATLGLLNDFILVAGGNIMTANVNGIQSGNIGTISTSIANRSFSSAANYTYTGTANQNSGVFTTTPTANQVNHLTINNTGGGTGVTLQQTMAVAGTCYFTAGLITSSTSFLLIFNDNAVASGANNNVTNPSYTNGPVRKIGNDAFIFPVGKSTVGYMYCGISAPSSPTDVFTAEYRRSSAASLGSITASGLYRVSACEYWQLDRTVGSATVNVTLSWSGLSPCNAAAYVNNLSFLVVAHFNGTNWNTYGASTTTGTGAAGSVTWNAVSVFSPFTLGSTSTIANPLPIKFTSIKAYTVGNDNKVEWTNATEENLVKYEVERSANGTIFNTLLTILPKTNNGQENKYTETDEHILDGVNYYRIKAIQVDGSFQYSTIVKVMQSTGSERSGSVYPNPVATNQFTVQLNNYKQGNYQLRLINGNGQIVMTKTMAHHGGSVSLSVEKSASAKPGVYILQVAGEGLIENMKVVFK